MTFKQGDIVMVCLQDGFGCEQHYDECRPALIVQNDVGNKYSKTTIIVPLTKRNKKIIPTHYFLEKSNYDFLSYNSILLCEQIRVIDNDRIERKIGRINNDDLDKIIKVIIKNFT